MTPPLILGDGKTSMDFIYIEDLTRANVLGLKSDTTDEEPCVRVNGKTCPKHAVDHWREAKSSVSDEEPKSSPSVDTWATAITIEEGASL